MPPHPHAHSSQKAEAAAVPGHVSGEAERAVSRQWGSRRRGQGRRPDTCCCTEGPGGPYAEQTSQTQRDKQHGSTYRSDLGQPAQTQAVGAAGAGAGRATTSFSPDEKFWGRMGAVMPAHSRKVLSAQDCTFKND